MHLGFWELLVILVIVLLVFGSTLIPKTAKSVNQAKKILKEDEEASTSEEIKAVTDTEAVAVNETISENE